MSEDNSEAQVHIDRRGEVLSFQLDNPAHGNEITGSMFETMVQVLHAEKANPRARVLHIRAAGEVFCLGRERAGRDEASIRAEIVRLVSLKRAIMDSPLISVAEVQGDAAGFGIGLAVVCDYTLVVDSAVLSFPEMRKGLPPAAIMAYLGRYALPKRILPLVMLAPDFTAAYAREIGLVTEVCTRESLRADTDALLARLLALEPEAAHQCKAYFHAAQEGTLEENFLRATDLLTARTLHLQAAKK